MTYLKEEVPANLGDEVTRAEKCILHQQRVHIEGYIINLKKLRSQGGSYPEAVH